MRNVFVSVTGKNLDGNSLKWLTDYTKGSKITVRTPQLVKISDEQFLALWEEKNTGDGTVRTAMVTLDGAGNATSEVVRTNCRLSDCQPIHCSDGIVRWYVSDGKACTMYQVHPLLLGQINVPAESVPTEAPSPSPTVKPSPTPTAKPSPTPTVAPTAKPTVSPAETPTAVPAETLPPVIKETPEPSLEPEETPTAKPYEAIRNTSGLLLKKTKHSWFLSYIFGIKGELAGNALKAQKKSLRISTLSLLLSFLGFSIMICFTTLADISTRYTYFERYQDVWDIMITLKDTEISDFGLTDELQDISKIQDATVYQKAEAMTFLPEGLQSNELSLLGGLESVAGTPNKNGQFQISAPIVVLDNTSFLNFCSQIGITPSLDGAIVLNQIWDSTNSNFRYKEYVPFVKEDNQETTLYKNDKPIEIPVLSYTQTAPTLREEYENYALVHFIPLAMWNKTLGEVFEAEADSYIRILSNGLANLTDLNSLEQEIVRFIPKRYKIESENRVQERLANDSLIQGMVIILGAFCVLLAIIGIANIFSNTLGFLRQRKREFAQYMSIGLTPQEMGKMFCIEAFVIAGKPLLITLPLTILFVQFAVTASHLDPMAFWAEAPILPILIFAAAIVLFVTLAYYIGGKRLLQCDLNETLQNDALV